MSNQQLYEQSQENFQRIDQRLDALVDITANQNILANNMYDELNNQMQIINDTSNHMDKAQMQVEKANQAVLEVKATSSQWCAWILMILLIIAIICVWIFVKR